MAEKQPHVKGDGKLPLSSGRFNSLHSVNDLMMVMIHLLICMTVRKKSTKSLMMLSNLIENILSKINYLPRRPSHKQ